MVTVDEDELKQKKSVAKDTDELKQTQTELQFKIELEFYGLVNTIKVM